MKDLLEKLNLEKHNDLDQKPQIEKSLGLEKIIEYFELYNQIISFLSCNSFKSVSNIMIPKEYTSNDITQFSITIQKEQLVNVHNTYSHYSHYLNSLIYHCKEKEIIIITKHLNCELKYLVDNSQDKKIIIIGPAGNWAGSYLLSGILDIQGYCGDFLGFNMHDGTIIVNGNAGKNIGFKMINGNICITQDYGSISQQIYSGNIYHQGKQIIKDGKPVDGAEIKWAKSY